MAYSDKVVDHFNNPRNMGSFKKDEEGVGTGMVGAPECGDVMKLQIKVQNDTIVDAKFKTFGCGSAIASCVQLPGLNRAMVLISPRNAAASSSDMGDQPW